MATKKTTKKSKSSVAKKSASKKPALKTKAKATKSKRQYSKAERTVLIVVYSAFASVFILFATDSGDNGKWYYILALVCLAMVLRHCAGVLKTYGEK